MNRTVYLTVGLTLILLLAGCSTPPESTPTSTTTHNHTHTSTTPSTTTATQSPDAQPLPAQVRATHTDALRTAGSFAATSTITLRQQNGMSETSFTTTTKYTVNVTQNRSQKVERGGLMTDVTTVYTNSTGTYKQTKDSESTSMAEASYEKATPPYDDSVLADVQPVNRTEAMGANWLIGLNRTAYTKTNTTTYNGVEVTVYRGTGLAALPQEFAGESLGTDSNTSVNKATAVVMVDTDGIVRYQQFMLNVSRDDQQSMTIKATHTVSTVGDTPVTPPTWLPYAQNASEENDDDYSFSDASVEVTQATGHVTDKKHIDRVNLTLSLDAYGDANSVALNNSSFELDVDGAETTVTQADAAVEFTVVADDDQSLTDRLTLNSENDQLRVTLDLTQINTVPVLEAGDWVSVSVRTGTDEQDTMYASIPESIADGVDMIQLDS